MNRIAVAMFCVSLAACGGGGGGDAAPPPPSNLPPLVAPSPTCTGAEAVSVAADATVTVGKAAGAVIAGCAGLLVDIQWTQTGGPAIVLLSARSQAISFEPTTAGTYSFAVTYRHAGGVTGSATVSTTAVAGTAAVLARVDQAVRKGGNVSLRAWPAAASGETITWTQTAGPQVTLNTSDQNRAIFVAPEVVRDTTLVFRVTRSDAAGTTTDTDDVFVLVENHAQAPPDPGGTGSYVFSDLHVSRVFPYRAAGPFAGVLVSCTYDASLVYTAASTTTCPLATLPFLAQTTNGALPTVDQIMDRVLVSHEWMGQVFEQFLATQASDDLKRLLNGVTAIVIGAHVRPSFYYAMTGAIYLDADNFWLTAEQRDVIDEVPDFRSDFDRDLMYSGLWRYVDGTQNIFLNFPATSRIARPIDYLLREAGWLLYHELGHASDFLPPAERPRLNNSLSLAPWDFLRTVTRPSTQLGNALPPQSAQMFALAQVKFHGATATDEQRAYTPDMVASFFAPDRASDEYSYSSGFEDLAMLFEEFMMFRNHGWRRDVGITDKITSSSTSSTTIVRWGRRGRIGEANITPRVELVVGQLAPWVALAEVQNLPAPLAMRPGDSWAGNLVLPAPLPGIAGAHGLRTARELQADRALLERSVIGGRATTPNERWLRRRGG